MALTNAEKQRRYRARHVLVKRDMPPAVLPQNGTAPTAVSQDLTAVRAALAEARGVLANPQPYASTMARQIQALMRVLETLVQSLEAH